MILIHHHVAPESAKRLERVDEGWDWSLTPELFERQLRTLARLGFRFVSLEETVDAIDAGRAEDPSTIVVTFDDGWRDQLLYAVPILREMNIPAAFFVTTEHLREGGTPDPRRLTREELLGLLDAGMTVGAHSRTHPNLTSLDRVEIEREVGGSREDLERALGRPPRFFAYPGGAFDARVVAAVRRAGYDAAASSFGPAQNDSSSIHWLFRDVLSPTVDKLSDRYRLSPLARRLLEFRVKRRLDRTLRGSSS